MKNIKIKVFIIILCLVITLGIIFFMLKTNAKKTGTDNSSSIANGIDEYSIISNAQLDLEANSFDNVNNNDTDILTEEVSSYWQNYKNPDHWSEKTNNYTLAYILDSNKNTEDNLEEKSKTIIENELPSDEKGVFVPKDSRQQLENFLKNNVDNKFYINEDGFLKYITNENALEISSDLTKLVNKLILDSQKLTILSIAYSYYDENNEIDNFATSIPIELNYLRFRPKENIELMIYSQYNFSLEAFTEGIENLTGETIKTK